MFVAGDDEEARQQVSELLRELGWLDIVELDGLQKRGGWRCGCRCRSPDGCAGKGQLNVELVADGGWLVGKTRRRNSFG